MTNLQRKFTTALATGAVLANAIAPAAFASTDLSVVGNGSHSDSDIRVERENETNVNQDNRANVDNVIKINASTGGNNTSDNTGGDVRVDTGRVKSDVTVINQLNRNHAVVDTCNGCDQDVTAKIGGNGTDSWNDIDLETENEVRLNQDNRAYVDNNVNVNADSGRNYAKDNTGGDVRVDTGDIKTKVQLLTAANVNSARIGGHGSEGGEISARILGNGSHSDNEIDLEFENEIDLDQDNYANIDNRVDVDADSGWNNVSDNTGGETYLYTGDVEAELFVDNMVNFNAANVEDCCFEDLTAKVAGNGTDSENEIEYEVENELESDQDNNSDLDNRLYVDGYTGDNDVNDNTGAYDELSDPRVETGNSVASAYVHNDGGVNMFGDVDFEFDFNDLMEWFYSFGN